MLTEVKMVELVMDRKTTSEARPEEMVLIYVVAGEVGTGVLARVDVDSRGTGVCRPGQGGRFCPLVWSLQSTDCSLSGSGVW